MHIVLLGIELYFATLLGTAGLAKLASPQQFAATLRQQGVFPRWSVGWISRLVPWLELGLACLLISGVAPYLAAVLTLLLFATFLLFKALLMRANSSADCGCGHAARPELVDGASITVSVILVALAALYGWAILTVAPLNFWWHMPGITVFSVGGGWLVFNMFLRRRVFIQHTKHGSRTSVF